MTTCHRAQGPRSYQRCARCLLDATATSQNIRSAASASEARDPGCKASGPWVGTQENASE
eukprot:3669258-Rhodomonas_salina.1